ncbi:MAG: GNAT family N-acetyltransferase, partial [Clostridia bacterium]|nr:GNAT family N-acetyltransferase [Clostridia bacterium]
MKTNVTKTRDPSALFAVTEPGQRDKLREYASEPEKLFALEQEGTAVSTEPVGWMYLHIPDEAKYSAFVYIYVAPAFRRQGIGRWVYREAEKKLLESGCDWWSSYPPSDASDAFCRSVGFTYTNTNYHMVWYGDERMPDLPADGIRPIEERDIPEGPMIWNREYARIHRELGIPYDETEYAPEQIENDRREIREHPERWNNVFVLEADGGPTAYGAVFREGDGVGAVAVDYALRNRGYGTRMTAYLTRECIRRGFAHPYLYCEAGNDSALHVYGKLGYRVESGETVAV